MTRELWLFRLQRPPTPVLTSEPCLLISKYGALPVLFTEPPAVAETQSQS